MKFNVWGKPLRTIDPIDKQPCMPDETLRNPLIYLTYPSGKKPIERVWGRGRKTWKAIIAISHTAFYKIYTDDMSASSGLGFLCKK